MATAVKYLSSAGLAGVLTIDELSGLPPNTQYGGKNVNVPDGSYFDVQIEGSGPLAGFHDGWCIDFQGTFFFGKTDFQANAFSTYDPDIADLIPEILLPENLPLVNWFYNNTAYDSNTKQYSIDFQDDNDPTYFLNYGEVQRLLWLLTDGIGGSPTFADVTADGLVDTVKVDSVVAAITQENAAQNFEPNSIDETIGIILKPTISGFQETLINVKLAELGDFVWLDENENGLQDEGEPGVDGVIVNLLADVDRDGTIEPGEIVATTTTDSNGEYLFLVTPGNYQVQFVDPENREFTQQYAPTGTLPAQNPGTDSNANPINGITEVITLKPGESNLTIDAGLLEPPQIPASLGDFVWHDLNANGIQDPGEPGIEGATVKLLDGAGNPVLDENGDPVVDITDGSGIYTFVELIPGDYKVMFVQPDGFGAISPFQVGNDPAVDSDANPNNGLMSDVITLDPGEFDNTIDAGFYKLGTIGDRIWSDNDGDGVQDAGEPGINGVTVKLINKDSNQLIDTDTTSGNGGYLFEDLPPGNYTIMVDTATLPSNVVQTGDPDNVLDDMSMVDLPSGGTNLDQDFGYQPLGTIGDRIWSDNNGDGVQDNDEPGINGVTVKLIDKDTSVLIDIDVTSGDGGYLFNNLPQGNYTIMVDTATLPDNVVQTGDPDDVLDDMSMVNLPAGGTNLDQDFGYQPLGTIGDRIWSDNNGDGVQDDGEPGINGVTVKLINKDTGVQIATDTTSGDGGYLFENLPQGNYTIMVDTNTLPSNVVQTGDPDDVLDDMSMVNLPAGGTNLDQDFGYQPFNPDIEIEKFTNGQDADTPTGPVIEVGGTAIFTYKVRNTGDTTLTNVEVIDDNGTPNDSSDDFEPIFVNGDNNGNGIFDPGEQWIWTESRTVTPGQYTNKAKVTAQAPNGETVMDMDPSNHFGEQKPAKLGDFVFNDLNQDGIQNAGEPGIAGVEVQLQNPNGQTLATTTTDGNGMYIFNDLTPGDYKVMFVQPQGFNGVSPFRVGNNRAIDSDANPNNGLMSDVVNLESGEFDNTIDAGFFKSLPGINIEKFTNGIDVDLNNPPEIVPGADVTFTYDVKNTGNVPFDKDEVIVIDDNGTPNDTSDDFNPMLVPSSDVGSDGILSPGETWLYTKTLPALDLSIVTETVIDFEGFSAGTIIDNEYQSQGVTIFAKQKNGFNANAAMIFDTNNPTGGDTDLATNNQGNVLIISEDFNSSDPDDNEKGGIITFTFDDPQTIKSLDLLDTEEAGEIRTYDAGGNLINITDIPEIPDGSQQSITVRDRGVSTLKIDLFGSGAITNLNYGKVTETIYKNTVTVEAGSVNDSDMSGYTNPSPKPGENVCDILGKPRKLTFEYNPGTDVVTGQDPNKAFAFGVPDFDGESFILVTDKKVKNTFFADTVFAGEDFTVISNKFDFGTQFFIFDDVDAYLRGSKPLQSLGYDTSCSQPIALGDIIGSVELVGYVGENGSAFI